MSFYYFLHSVDEIWMQIQRTRNYWGKVETVNFLLLSLFLVLIFLH